MSTIGPVAYRVTKLDELALLRAVQAEAQDPTDRARVAQALINRFAMLRARDASLYPTLMAFVFAYARSINPRWMLGGDLYQRATHGKTGRVLTAMQESAKRRKRNAERMSFDGSTEAAVSRALSRGPVDLESVQVTDFSQAWGDTPHHLRRVTPHTSGHNTYYQLARPPEGWRGYTVQGSAASRSGSQGAGLLLLAMVAGLIGVAAAQRRRRR